jgi:hypothetical protein
MTGKHYCVRTTAYYYYYYCCLSIRKRQQSSYCSPATITWLRRMMVDRCSAAWARQRPPYGPPDTTTRPRKPPRIGSRTLEMRADGRTAPCHVGSKQQLAGNTQQNPYCSSPAQVRSCGPFSSLGARGVDQLARSRISHRFSLFTRLSVPAGVPPVLILPRFCRVKSVAWRRGRDGDADADACAGGVGACWTRTAVVWAMLVRFRDAGAAWGPD